MISVIAVVFAPRPIFARIWIFRRFFFMMEGARVKRSNFSSGRYMWVLLISALDVVAAGEVAIHPREISIGRRLLFPGKMGRNPRIRIYGVFVHGCYSSFSANGVGGRGAKSGIVGGGTGVKYEVGKDANKRQILV